MINKVYNYINKQNHFDNLNDSLTCNFINYIAKRAELKHIIFICKRFFALSAEIIIIDFKDDINAIKTEIKNAKVLKCNIMDIDEKIISESVIFYKDETSHKIVNKRFFTDIKYINNNCKYLILSPDSLNSYNKLVNSSKWNLSNYFTGYFPESVSKNAMILSGKEININKNCEYKKILAIVHVYNEEDFIGNTIEHLLAQGLDIYVLDNWSTDRTCEILLQYKEKYGERIYIEHFPKEPTNFYQWGLQLKKTEEVAFANEKYDWFLHYDADEIRVSPWEKTTLAQAINFVDSLGYNAIDFTVLDFRPTMDNQGTTNANTLEENIYFEFGKRPGHFKQIKAWKRVEGIRVDLSSSGGHEASFEGRKVYPVKFLLKHYSIRTPEQAKKKIFEDRKKRFSKEELEKGWHIQYNQYSPEESFLWDRANLIRWDDTTFATEYLVERISGIGINRD